jgi:Ca2+-binding RTX toxin-like protein
LIFVKRENNLVIAILDARGNESGSVTIADWYLDAKNRIARIVFADGSLIEAAEIEILVNNPPTLIYGTEGNDTLRSSAKSGSTVIVYGLGGNDTIYGKVGTDVFVPGPGVNTIYARTSYEGGGQKTFVLNTGDGDSTVYYYNPARKTEERLAILRFGHNIGPENVTVYNRGYDVAFVVTLEGSNAGSLTFKDANKGSIHYQMDEIQFADGTVWEWSDVVNRKVVLGTEGDDEFYTRGIAGEKITVYGLGGNDTIYGGNANETFVPGHGVNTIYARESAEGKGQKTFVFNVGDGDSTVYYDNSYRKTGDGLAILRFGHDISPENVTVYNREYDVTFVVTLEGKDVGSLTFKEANRGGYIRYQMDEIQFSDGTIWKWSDAVNRKTVLGTDEIGRASCRERG